MKTTSGTPERFDIGDTVMQFSSNEFPDVALVLLVALLTVKSVDVEGIQPRTLKTLKSFPFIFFRSLQAPRLKCPLKYFIWKQPQCQLKKVISAK